MDNLSQKPNLIIVLWYKKKLEVIFLLLHWQEATQSLRTWYDYLWPWESLTWFLYNLQQCCHGHWFWEFTVRLQPIWKELESSVCEKYIVMCFYRVIETQVEVWENEKCCGNTSSRWVFPQLFGVLPNFLKCFYNSIKTRSTYYLFFLENTATIKRKTTC